MKTFAVLGGDLRCVYLAKSLAEDGYQVIVAGFDPMDLPDCVTGCSHIAQAASPADCVILPLPVTTDGKTLNAPFAKQPILLDEVLEALRPEQTIVGGNLTESLGKRFTAKRLSIYDYFASEELAIQNAVPTAEGAVMLAMQELPTTIFGASCLVTGFGKVAKALARTLHALGAHVTVAARRSSDRAFAETEGMQAISTEDVSHIGEFDVCFNTVPALLFSESVLERLSPKTLLIDLASRPGGVDFTAAAKLGVKTIWALSLPGRVAPESAGRIIKRSVYATVDHRGESI